MSSQRKTEINAEIFVTSTDGRGNVITTSSASKPIAIFERAATFECDDTEEYSAKIGQSAKNFINYDSHAAADAANHVTLRPATLGTSFSKNIYSAPSLAFYDANSVADALGVAPAFRQKETLRWNSAFQVYKQMSCQDLSKLDGEYHYPDDLDDNPVINDANDGVAFNDPMRTGNFRSSSSHKPTATGSNLLSPDNADLQHGPTTFGPLSLSSFTSMPSRRCGGFLTPPLRQTSIAGELAELAKRQFYNVGGGSYVSPGESSLNSLELEAIAAVHELQFAVKDIFVSELLPRTSELIFLNLTTLEGQPHCVELTMKGWRVTSLRHDCMNGDIRFIDLHVKFFETIYALMDNISVGYRGRFSEAVSDKLNLLLLDRAGFYGDNRATAADIHESDNSTYGNPIVVNFLNSALQQK